MDGELILEVTSADIPGLLDDLVKHDVAVTELLNSGPLSVRFRVGKENLETIRKITEHHGDTLRIYRRMGIYWKLGILRKHWLLLIGLCAILLLTGWLPTRILFVRVSGNEIIPSRLILEKAAQCGIVFGADRGAVRSERMKNALLDELPQLQWAGVNTAGCVAVITVEERKEQPDTENKLPGTIVACRDGIVLELTAVRGTPAVKPGQAVRSGDVLISGYTDCGGVILMNGAQGEVYGQTVHRLSARTPEKWHVRGSEIGSSTKISLHIGKNRINFYEDSGILDTGCVKMYEEYCMSLPGGWVLPVKLVVETVTRYEILEQPVEQQTAERLLSEQTAAYLRSTMIGGMILSEKPVTDGCLYNGEFVCREMIGRLVYEEIVTEYGEDH